MGCGRFKLVELEMDNGSKPWCRVVEECRELGIGQHDDHLKEITDMGEADVSYMCTPGNIESR